MKTRFLVLALTAGSVLAWAQTNPKSHESKSEQATEARSGIHDRVDVVSGPSVDQVTGNSAVLHWTTNKVAATRVNYGTDPGKLSQKAYEPGGSTNHSVTLSNLRPHQKYYYEIENRAGKDRLNGSFSTP